MSRVPWLRAAPLALVLAGASPNAEQRPQLRPTRDVDISYSITRPNGSRIRERVRWLAADQLERVDGSDRSSTIFNRKSGEITLLVPSSRTYRKLEADPRGPIEPEMGAQLTRGGESEVAGQRCAEWSWTDNGEKHTLCATADGVLLRHIVDGKTVVQALSVVYRQQKADLFDVPKGYEPALAPEGNVGP